MHLLTFSRPGISVELPAQDDHFLNDIFHLVLELKLSDGSVDRVDLLSRDPTLGVWDANGSLGLPETIPHYTLSVFVGLGGQEHQLVASKELYGPELFVQLGDPVKILLSGHENYLDMVFKAKVMAVNPFGQMSGEKSDNINNTTTQGQEGTSLNLDDYPDKPSRLTNLGIFLLTRFKRFGNLDDINNAVVRLQAAVNLTPD
ncbi:hypothetical protein FS842_001407, partial [Serendipita sp. 407]